ncbi:MAG: YoaP domain-containing protein, partial [Bacteroidota bacterium]
QNVDQQTLYCIKNIKSEGYKAKKQWFTEQFAKGLRLDIIQDPEENMLGFIEYVPAENAWRPITAPGFMFIHCIFVYPNKNKNLGNGSLLIHQAEKEARSRGMNGLCTMTSKGSWVASKKVFIKNGFEQVGKLGRFELLCKKWASGAPDPVLVDWTANQKKYQGWHLVYTNQCPWHQKSAEALLKVTQEHGIDLNITLLKTAKEARKAPSGFGVFSLLHNGKLLEDHYLSETRFRNILKKELQES